MAESKKSLFRPTKPRKYKGDPTNIICRSSWENKFCSWCDLNENIVEWGSEEFGYPTVLLMVEQDVTFQILLSK